ncbi:MAG: ferritin-like domain-containing protein [Acidimicrobiales bacterium]
MTAPTPPHDVLELPDHHVSLDLGETVPAIRRMYRAAVKTAWDPETAIPWDEVNPEQYSPEVIEAARVYWSRRAWGEYGAISESPAMQFRYVLEGREPDLSLFWALRTQEEVRHAEVCMRMADALGGYHLQPSDEELKAIAGALGTRARVLDRSRPLEVTIAGLVCVAETVVYDVFLELVRAATNPVAKQIFRLILRDEVRHCDFGWEYLAHRAPQMSADELEDCRQAMISMIRDVELAGYRSAWLAVDPTPEEVAVDELVFDAGLGGVRAEWEGPIVVASIRAIRGRAAGLGLELPTFQHHLLGEI